MSQTPSSSSASGTTTAPGSPSERAAAAEAAKTADAPASVALRTASTAPSTEAAKKRRWRQQRRKGKPRPATHTLSPAFGSAQFTAAVKATLAALDAAWAWLEALRAELAEATEGAGTRAICIAWEALAAEISAA